MGRIEAVSGARRMMAAPCHSRRAEPRQRAEEYVLDERELSGGLSSVMGPEKRDRSGAKQRHECPVRRSTELRTVSIIDTLSELVAQTDACHLGGPHDDCDAHCTERCRPRPPFCHCVTSAIPSWSALETNLFPRSCTESICSSCERSPPTGAPEKGGGAPTFKGREGIVSPKIREPSGAAANADKNGPPQDKAVGRSRRQQSGACQQSGLAAVSPRDQGQTEPNVAATENCIHRLARCVCTKGCDSRRSPPSAIDRCCPRDHRSPVRRQDGLPSSRRKGSSRVGNAASPHSRTPAHPDDPASPKCGRRRILAVTDDDSTQDAASRNHRDRSCTGVRRTTTATKPCPHAAVHDLTDFMLSTLRSKGRTPDWIAGIFSISRRGNLDKLKQALTDMDATLIRNLSDHRGNNLFHVCCCYGHLECLQWLLQRGKQCEDAILDENKYELTPLVCAVKYGKLPCVEWLIRNTIAQGQLVPGNGSRPLLHWAAKYGQEVILKWLAEYMENNGMNVNVKDGYGNTALHLAAKHGHAVSIKALVSHRCDVSLKNDLGYKASDYAILYGQTACSEYLLSLEACLLLSSDVASLDADLGSTKAEMSEMKVQFKDVLSCAKKLVKEREELSQHLDRLQDGLVHLNDIVIAEIQALCEENSSLRKQLINGGEKIENSRQSLDETVALCRAMHTRWQDGQQRWLSPTALADIQQKILLAEERWKRARARVTWGDKETKEHMNVFRERLAQVQCRTTGIRLSEIRSISSSESSLASMEDTLSEYEERYEQAIPSKHSSVATMEPRCSCRKMDSTEEQHILTSVIPAFSKSSCATGVQHSKAARRVSSIGEFHRTNSDVKPCNLGSSLFSKSVKKVSGVIQEYRLDKIPSLDCSGGLQKREAVHSMGSSGQSRGLGLVSQGTCKVLEVIVSPNSEKNLGGNVNGVDDFINQLEHSWETGNSSKGNQGFQDLSASQSKMDASSSASLPQQKKFKQDPLLGNCKLDGNVLEGKRDDDDDDDDNGGNEQQRGNGRGRQKGLGGGNDCVARKETFENSSGSSSEKKNERYSTRDNPDLNDKEMDRLEFLEIDAPTASLESVHACSHPNYYNGKLISPEPDLIIGTKGIRTDFEVPISVHSNEGETAGISRIRQPMSASANVSSENLAEDELGQLNVEQDLVDIPFNEDEMKPLLNASSGSSFLMDDICMGISLSSNSAGKRRGFLQKLNLRWPSKRKVKNAKRVQEITPEDFRETYMHSRNANGIEDPFMEVEGISVNGIVTDGSLGSQILGSVNISKPDTNETCEGDSGPKFCTPADVKEYAILEQQPGTLEANMKESLGLSVKQTNDAPSSSCLAVTIDCENEQNVVIHNERSASHPKIRHLPAPPVPVEPRCPPPPPNVNVCSTFGCTTDHHLAKHDSNLKNTGNSCLVQKQTCSEERRSCVSGSSLGSAKEQFVGEKTSSRPEADQNMRMLIGLELDISDEQSTLIHSQADMPPLRPVSRGAKSDQSIISRPESSASRAESYIAYRLPGFPLRKVSSLSADLLTPGSSTPNRMSPAPSEVSKTESALSPPSDISKTESMRNLKHLTRIEEKVGRVSQPIPALPMKRLAEIKTATVVDTNLEVQKQMQLQGHISRNSGDSTQDSQLLMRTSSKDLACTDQKNVTANSGVALETRHSSEVEKPWYELSDDEELLMPETLKRSIGLVKNGSEDEDVYYCT